MAHVISKDSQCLKHETAHDARQASASEVTAGSSFETRRRKPGEQVARMLADYMKACKDKHDIRREQFAHFNYPSMF